MSSKEKRVRRGPKKCKIYFFRKNIESDRSLSRVGRSRPGRGEVNRVETDLGGLGEAHWRPKMVLYDQNRDQNRWTMLAIFALLSCVNCLLLHVVPLAAFHLCVLEVAFCLALFMFRDVGCCEVFAIVILAMFSLVKQSCVFPLLGCGVALVSQVEVSCC